jgi:hypothetical protein
MRPSLRFTECELRNVLQLSDSKVTNLLDMDELVVASTEYKTVAADLIIQLAPYGWFPGGWHSVVRQYMIMFTMWLEPSILSLP